MRVAKTIHLGVWVVPIALVLIALVPLPYDYYRILRVIVCGAAAFLAWSEFQERGLIAGWAIGLIAVAVIFNPAVPLRLERETWMVLDVVAAAILGGHLFARSRRPAEISSSGGDDAGG
jgi:Na+/proline symporter